MAKTMTRRDASSRNNLTKSSYTLRSNRDTLSLEEQIEMEEKESRINLSLSIMNNAMQAANAEGSNNNFGHFPSSRSLVDNQSVKSFKSGGETVEMLPIDRHLNESGWNLDKIHTSNISNELHRNTRNRRICMYIVALIIGAIISSSISEKMGTPKLQDVMFEEPGETVKYSGNYTDISTFGASDGKITADDPNIKTTKRYKKEKYKIPANIDGTDDFVDIDQVLPTLLDANFDDIFNEQNKRKLMMDDVPYFWLIPRTGGNSVRYVMSYCFKAVLACETDADRHNEKVRTFVIYYTYTLRITMEYRILILLLVSERY